MPAIPQTIVDYGDSIPLIFGWTDDTASTDYPPTPLPVTLVGVSGTSLNVPTKQLVYFTLIDEATGLPVVGYNPQYFRLNTTPVRIDNVTFATTAAFTIQLGPDANGFIPVGTYTVVAQYDSTQSTDDTIRPLRKKAFARVVVRKNPRGDANPVTS